MQTPYFDASKAAAATARGRDKLTWLVSLKAEVLNACESGLTSASLVLSPHIPVPAELAMRRSSPDVRRHLATAGHDALAGALTACALAMYRVSFETSQPASGQSELRAVTLDWTRVEQEPSSRDFWPACDAYKLAMENAVAATALSDVLLQVEARANAGYRHITVDAPSDPAPATLAARLEKMGYRVEHIAASKRPRLSLTW